jgi:predicted acylesterase/phospholipase RssA
MRMTTVAAMATVAFRARSLSASMPTTRILSLDGGGTHAGTHARALGEIYGHDTPGREIIREFDFVAGNSGGSIVFTALCCNYKPWEIAGFYNDPDVLKKLFSPRWNASIPILRNLMRYSSKGKFDALKTMFDARRQPGEPLPSSIKLSDWPIILERPVNLMVTAFDYDRERAAFFRTNTGSLAQSSGSALEATLVEAVHASTNPPIVYYDKPAEVSGRRYWDGALAGYNNPVLAAVVEALTNRASEVDEFRVLSIGTVAHVQPLFAEGAPAPLGKPPASTCLFSALRKAATVVTDDPPDVATFHAHLALRQPVPTNRSVAVAGNLVRICPLVRPIWDETKHTWARPSGLIDDDFARLIDMQLDPMRRRDLDLIQQMLDLWIADELPNQPIRMGDHFRCDIGHDRFSDAVRHWREIQ